MSSAAIRGTARITGVKRSANIFHINNAANNMNLKDCSYVSTTVPFSGNSNINKESSYHLTVQQQQQQQQQQILNTSYEMPGNKKARSSVLVTSAMGAATIQNNYVTRSSSWR